MPFRRRILLRHALIGACLGWAMPTGALARRRHHHTRTHHHARKRPVVVIDPGHGGKDPGCISPSGTEEKTVVLELGRELRHQLEAGGHCRVVMTRDSDVFVPLEKRVAFARKHHATAMVSLHANSSPDRHARGVLVYRFAFHASDAQARAQAKWENSADRYGGPSFKHTSRAVTHILASLMRRETWLHSAWLQDSMVRAMRHHVRLEEVPARHARFVVLSAPDIPSVLIETGFLTNHADARLLRSKRYRRRMARLMRHAIERDLAHVARTTRTGG